MPKKIHFWKKNGGKRLAACGLEGVENLTRDVDKVTCKNCLRAAEDGVVSVEVPLVAATVTLKTGGAGEVPSTFDEDARKDEVMAPTGSWVERDDG